MNREAEQSGPLVMTYLMNWGDCFLSHQYISVYWCQLANALKQVYPHLQETGRGTMDDLIDDDIVCDSEMEVNYFHFKFSYKEKQ